MTKRCHKDIFWIFFCIFFTRYLEDIPKIFACYLGDEQVLYFEYAKYSNKVLCRIGFFLAQ